MAWKSIFFKRKNRSGERFFLASSWNTTKRRGLLGLNSERTTVLVNKRGKRKEKRRNRRSTHKPTMVWRASDGRSEDKSLAVTLTEIIPDDYIRRLLRYATGMMGARIITLAWLYPIMLALSTSFPAFLKNIFRKLKGRPKTAWLWILRLNMFIEHERESPLRKGCDESEYFVLPPMRCEFLEYLCEFSWDLIHFVL